MRIWVDADACPQVIKEILYRAAERVQVLTTLVANSALRIPPSDFIRTVRVSQGSDVADHRIVQEVEPGLWRRNIYSEGTNRPGTAAFSNAGKSGGGLYGRDQ